MTPEAPRPNLGRESSAIQYDLSSRSGPFVDRAYELGTPDDRAYWRERYAKAQAFMRSRHHIPRTLIEIASQHPLKNGEEPGEEFECRLLAGMKLLQEELQLGRQVEIYVPGSRHVHEGVADNLSLSTAGINFLAARGVDRSLMHGDDLSLRYKGEAGVYGSADECFVAASYFRDSEFGRLISVHSPVQVARKMFHYIEFGVIVEHLIAQTPNPFHDPIGEFFSAVPRVLVSDPDLQSPDSTWGAALREARMPKMV